MRVLVLTTSYPLSPRSVSGRFLHEALEGLVPHGWSFRVVTPAPPAGPVRAGSGPLVVDAVAFPGYRHGLAHAGGIPDRLARSPWLAALLPGMWYSLESAAERCAREERFDLVWSHWLLPAGWIGASLSARTGLPHLATGHGADVHLTERIARIPGGRAWLRARFAGTRLSAPAPFTAERMSAALGTAEVASVSLPASAAGPAARRRAEGGPLRVLFLGRFEPIKGAALLLEAAALPDAPAMEIVMAGAGGEAPALRAMARRVPHPVHFPGVLTGSARLGALREAEVLVVPSLRARDGRGEGLPHAAALALAAGVPVVTSDGGALAQLVRAHEAGVVFDARGGRRAAASRLAAALGAVAALPGRWERLAAGARAAGVAFHPERVLPEWDRLLRSTAAARSTGAATDGGTTRWALR